LVDDPGGGRHDREVIERLLAPAQKFIALAVALELELRVEPQRLVAAEHIHLHRAAPLEAVALNPSYALRAAPVSSMGVARAVPLSKRLRMAVSRIGIGIGENGIVQFNP
jgi:predicted membrane protein